MSEDRTDSPTTEVVLGDDGSVTATRRDGEDVERYHRSADGRIEVTQHFNEVEKDESIIGLRL